METLEAEVADLRREVEHLKHCHACIDGSHDLRVGDEVSR